MNVLALDLGTRFGYALLTNGVLTHGSINTKKAKDKKERGPRFLRFYDELDSMLYRLDGEEVDLLVVYEDVKRHVGTAAAHVYGGYKAIMEMWAHDYGFKCEGVGVGTIKKHITGKGRASKEEVIEAVNKVYGFSVTDDNEADALAILHYALNKDER